MTVLSRASPAGPAHAENAGGQMQEDRHRRQDGIQAAPATLTRAGPSFSPPSAAFLLRPPAPPPAPLNRHPSIPSRHARRRAPPPPLPTGFLRGSLLREGCLLRHRRVSSCSRRWRRGALLLDDAGLTLLPGPVLLSRSLRTAVLSLLPRSSRLLRCVAVSRSERRRPRRWTADAPSPFCLPRPSCRRTWPLISQRARRRVSRGVIGRQGLCLLEQ